MSGEQVWITCLNFDMKKYIARVLLCWCKRQRDLFDDCLEYLDEPTSVINCEIWVDEEKYEQKWAERVNVWRQRYYNTIKAYVHPKVKGSADAELVAINNCAKAEATTLHIWDVFFLTILHNQRMTMG